MKHAPLTLAATLLVQQSLAQTPPAVPPVVVYYVCTAVANTGAKPFTMRFDADGLELVNVQRFGANALVNVGGLAPPALAQITKACTGH